ncbi:hypothetical protein [Bradyrhizobium canariense]|uniref:hypothetical protein n=1 Tax=Bradyrhizobium canariense TaxID=255045 RepID=UPI00137484A2|nr:hypothetical protein [Bradyrhizobium canariense]
MKTKQQSEKPSIARVRELNDSFRHDSCGGRMVMTRSVADLPEGDQASVFKQVC